MKIHISDIALGDFEFLETVITEIDPIIAQYLLGIDIMYLPVGGQGLVIRILDGGSETGRSLQQNPHRHQRHDPLGRRTGLHGGDRQPPSRFFCKPEGHPCQLRHSSRPGRQPAEYGFHIILAMIFRDLRHHHVAAPCMTPDDFIGFIHNPLSCPVTISKHIICKQFTIIHSYHSKRTVTKALQSFPIYRNFLKMIVFSLLLVNLLRFLKFKAPAPFGKGRERILHPTL